MPDSIAVPKTSDTARHASGSDWQDTGATSVRKVLIAAMVALALGVGGVLVYGCARAMIPVQGSVANWAGGRVGFDFLAFHAGARLASRGEAALAYDPEVLHVTEQELVGVPTELLPWAYPPIYLLMLLPLGLLPYLPAFFIWSAITASALMLVVRRIAKHWHAPLFVLVAPPAAFSLAAGQNGTLSAALLGAGMAALNRSPLATGVAFGCLAYKPQIAAAIPVCLIAGRHYREAAIFAMTAFGLGVCSLLVFGHTPWQEFFSSLSAQSQRVLGSELKIWDRVPSVMILALQATGHRMTAWLAQLCMGILAIGTAAWIWRRTADSAARATALTAAIPLCTPYIWDYDLAILLIPLAYLAWKSWTTRFTYGCTMILLTMWFSNPGLWWISEWAGWQIGPLVFTVLLIYAVWLSQPPRVARPVTLPTHA